jgi:hypothetical protein
MMGVEQKKFVAVAHTRYCSWIALEWADIHASETKCLAVNPMYTLYLKASRHPLASSNKLPSYKKS